MVCDRCKIDYPPEAVNTQEQFRAGRWVPIATLCGICALESANELTAVKRERFDGPRAEAIRQAALRYRKAQGIPCQS